MVQVLNNLNIKFEKLKKDLWEFDLSRLEFYSINKWSIFHIVIFLMNNFSYYIYYCVLSSRNNMVWLYVEKEKLNDLMFFLLKNKFLKFNMLIDIAVVDYYNHKSSNEVSNKNKSRFEVNYLIRSTIHKNLTICVRTFVNENDWVPTVSNLWKSAISAEREQSDMFGVLFEGNPDLRRILSDYGSSLYPLRKDCPLSGFEELRFDDEKNQIIYEPVELAQQFRSYNIKRVWMNENNDDFLNLKEILNK